jgi:Fur family ferric uptake transcriptional regulator
VDEVHSRAAKIDARISIATVYRTVRLFEDAGIVERHDFRDGRSRYEQVSKDHHDHLIDMESGTVIEFSNDQIEKLQELVATELGYKLVDHRLELYCVPLESAKEKNSNYWIPVLSRFEFIADMYRAGLADTRMQLQARS